MTSTVPADVEDRLARLTERADLDVGFDVPKPGTFQGTAAMVLGVLVAIGGLAGLGLASSVAYWLAAFVLEFLAGCAFLAGAILVFAGLRLRTKIARTPVERVAACIAGTRSHDLCEDPPRALRYLMLRMPGGARREFCVPEAMADAVDVGDLGWAWTREDELVAFHRVRD